MHRRNNGKMASPREWLPWGTQAGNMLRMASPKTWFGFVQYLRWTGLDVGRLWCHTWYSVLLVPLWLVLLLDQHCATTPLLSHDMQQVGRRLVVASLLSPLTIASWMETAPLWSQLIAAAHLYLIAGRKVTLPEAHSLLLERLVEGRVIRQRRYDLYLPPPPNNQTTGGRRRWHTDETDANSGILFLPGALVSHEAYAPVAAALSDQGFFVAILSMEPLRLACPNLGGDAKNLMSIRRDIARRIPSSLWEKKPTSWSIVGHSLGGYAAMRLGSELQDTIRSIILWGAGNRPQFLTDLSQTYPGNVLIIHASGDAYAGFTNNKMPEMMRLLKAHLPPPQHCKIVKISGGNHNGFASYGPTVPMYDGIATISRTRQHQLVSDITARFIHEHQ